MGRNEFKMEVETLPVNLETLSEHARIPISFKVSSKIEIQRIGSGLGGLVFKEVSLDPPYIKDYDEEQKPQGWLKIFNVEKWCLIRCLDNGDPVGGAVLVTQTPEVRMLDGRDDLSIVWDIRVLPNYRRLGVGTRLFGEAFRWSKQRGLRQMKVETQNINVPACKFYANQGCRLGEISFHKYITKSCANEVMLVWYLDL